MIKSKSVSSNERYLITPSLLNSWGYIWECVKNVKDSENDSESLEDKILNAQKKAYDDFLNSLHRIKTEPNEYMKEGLRFEDECYKGNTCISPIIEKGCFQIVGKKDITIDDMNFLMYGRLDVLKGGVIYDIKRVWKYSPQKYLGSYQHGFYMDLFSRAKKFEYLVFDGVKLHKETYYRDDYKSTKDVIKDFINWLKQENLLEIYKEKWRCKDYG